MSESRSGAPGDEPQLVVAAAIARRGRLLAARRTAPPALAGGWELPGGKVEPGEPPADALVRELREELGVAGTVGERIGPDLPLGDRFVLRVYAVTVPDGADPRPLLDHDELRWLAPQDLESVPWLPGDLPAARAAMDVLVGPGD